MISTQVQEGLLVQWLKYNVGNFAKICVGRNETSFAVSKAININCLGRITQVIFHNSEDKLSCVWDDRRHFGNDSMNVVSFLFILIDRDRGPNLICKFQSIFKEIFRLLNISLPTF
jgi:hypothetical protein